LNFKFDTIRSILEITSHVVFKTECDIKITALETIDEDKCLVSLVANNIPFKALLLREEDNIILNYNNQESNEIYEFTIEKINSEGLEDLYILGGEYGIIGIGREKNINIDLLDNNYKESILSSPIKFHRLHNKKNKPKAKTINY